MHPDTRQVAEHMRKLGMAILGRATYDLTFSEMMRPYAHYMAISHAAQGAEIAIKARIAQEHPLLLFNSLPKSGNSGDMLTIQELYEYGRTVQYNDLPEALWAATGIRMKDVPHFQSFGKLRNASVHFAVPAGVNVHELGLKFLFQVMQPLVYDFWQESIVKHAAEWDEYVWEEDGLRGVLGRCVEITPLLDALLTRSRTSLDGLFSLRILPVDPFYSEGYHTGLTYLATRTRFLGTPSARGRPNSGLSCGR